MQLQRGGLTNAPSRRLIEWARKVIVTATFPVSSDGKVLTVDRGTTTGTHKDHFIYDKQADTSGVATVVEQSLLRQPMDQPQRPARCVPPLPSLHPESSQTMRCEPFRGPLFFFSPASVKPSWYYGSNVLPAVVPCLQP